MYTLNPAQNAKYTLRPIRLLLLSRLDAATVKMHNDTIIGGGGGGGAGPGGVRVC